MSYALCSLVLSSFNTVDFAQNAAAYDDIPSHEHAHAPMLHVGHLDSICAISYYNTQCLRVFGLSYAHCPLILARFNTLDFAPNAEAYNNPGAHEHAHAHILNDGR